MAGPQQKAQQPKVWKGIFELVGDITVGIVELPAKAGVFFGGAEQGTEVANAGQENGLGSWLKGIVSGRELPPLQAQPVQVAMLEPAAPKVCPYGCDMNDVVVPSVPKAPGGRGGAGLFA